MAIPIVEDPYYDQYKPVVIGRQGQDVEEIETTVARYRPESIDTICRLTRFNRREVQIMYRGFKQCCPTGIVSLAQFKEIYAQFFPQGMTSKYAEFVFRTFDRDGNGMISFEEFVLGLSILSRGTTDDKLAWVFDLYDNKRRGFIDRDEMFIVVQSIYDLMGSYTDPPVDRNSVGEHVAAVFQRMDANRDGFITRAEFIETCKQDSAISNSLYLFDTKL
uniref:EF-hand domain-containing protein n=1 Tax=Plectus sambesii TaxID=2011161 RepID=A0A914WSF4_9BILA